jgi:hypothetical protein
MNYQQSKNYISLPLAGKRIIDNFHSTGNRTELFNSIKDNVDEMNKSTTKYIRQSAFRGALKNLFGFTEEDLLPIKFTIEESNAYNNELHERMDERKQMTISAGILRDMIQADPVIELLCRSGVRIAELFERITVTGRTVYVDAYKKAPNMRRPEELHILGSIDDWIMKYNSLDKSNLSASSRKVNRKLKSILGYDNEKQSSHLCRAIFARYVYQFENTQNMTLDTVIRRYLHHDSMIAAIHYQYLLLTPDVQDVFSRGARITYTETQLNDMGVPRLNELLTLHNIAGRSKMRKKADKVAALLLI